MRKINLVDIGKKYQNSIIKLVTYLLIFYGLFLLGRSLFVNYNLKQSITKLNEQIATLEKEKKNLENLNLYYQSDSFKELEARKKLGLKAPGEKVFVLAATPTTQNFPEEINKEKEKTAPQSSESQIPNWLLWWEFFTE